MSEILSIRLWCLPPSYSDEKKASNISLATPTPITLSPKHSILALLWFLAALAL